MKNKIEEILEEMSKVEPDKLSSNAYMFYRTVCEILDNSEKLYKFKDRCQGAVEYIRSRQDNMIPEHYEDLMHILTQSEEGEW